MKIDERKQRVLEAIIKDYVATAEPVGSRTIARKYNLGVSPATIRNEMADLEEMGFIEQPHTSAGRIPSQFGYRYYVDCLMETYTLSEMEENLIRSRFLQKMGDLEQVIQETGKFLSWITNYTAIISGPGPVVYGRFKTVELLPLQERAALLIVITESGAVIHKKIELPESVTPVDLTRISQVMSDKLQGITLNELRRTILMELYDELQREKNLLQIIIDLLEETLKASEWEKVYLGGIINILNQPEFHNIEKVRRILGVLEKENEIRELLNEGSEEGITVRIGGENRQEEFQECSVITITYEIKGEAAGRVGLLGPTRMEYPRTAALLKHAARALSEVLRGF